ncbi:hypothetical protein GCM10010965_27540 [Caldalkalibacillus thermarum]|nr:hypothetical protein GCM10010965_27540 [Caldalkalibacillus thermarum]
MNNDEIRLLAIKPKNRQTVVFEISYQGQIVDVIYDGEVQTDNEVVMQFVAEQVLPYLPGWIGWKRIRKKR